MSKSRELSNLAKGLSTILRREYEGDDAPHWLVDLSIHCVFVAKYNAERELAIKYSKPDEQVKAQELLDKYLPLLTSSIDECLNGGHTFQQDGFYPEVKVIIEKMLIVAKAIESDGPKITGSPSTSSTRTSGSRPPSPTFM